MRVYQNRRFHSKGPFIWRNRHSNPEDVTLKAPSPSNVPKRLSRAKPPEKFTSEEILLSSMNPKRVEVQRLFNPNLDFSPISTNTLTSLSFPILSGMLNTNPNFSSPCISASLSRNPDLIYPRPVHISPPSFSAPVPFPCMNVAIDPNRISLFSKPPYSATSRISPFNHWFRISFDTRNPHLECANYVNR